MDCMKDENLAVLTEQLMVFEMVAQMVNRWGLHLAEEMAQQMAERMDIMLVEKQESKKAAWKGTLKAQMKAVLLVIDQAFQKVAQMDEELVDLMDQLKVEQQVETLGLQMADEMVVHQE